MHNVGIIGCGFVGTAVSTCLQNIAEVREHDKYKDTESLDSVVSNSDIIFICLPTPMAEDGSCDTSIVENEIDNICRIARKPKSIVIKSTVTPGTTDKLQKKYKKHVFLFNPEFLTERNFIADFMNQDRIILGTSNDFKRNELTLRVHKLYQDFVRLQKKPALIYDTETRTAEMLKYMTNSFLATKVIFFNEMKEICKAANIKYEDVVGLMKLDERIGKSHLSVPGPDGKRGFGGSCFVKDLNALSTFAKELDLDPMVLDSVWTKNLLVREEYEWEQLAQVTGEYKKNEV